MRWPFRRQELSPGSRTLSRAATAGALSGMLVACGLLTGCGLVPSNRATAPGSETSAPTQNTAPPPSSAPSPSPTPTAPARSVTAANLLTVDFVPNDDPVAKEVVEAPDKQGRPVSQSYVCLPADGLSSLGATAMVTRNFTYKIIDAESDPYPDSPLKNKPSVYTQALQFPDEATATKARATYAGWIKGCAKTLTDKGYTIDRGQSLPLTKLSVENAHAQAGMVAYVQPGGDDAENLYWESAGVTQVKDRLMFTVTIGWGMDTPGTFDDSDGDFIHPQLILAEESVEPLSQ